MDEKLRGLCTANVVVDMTEEEINRVIAGYHNPDPLGWNTDMPILYTRSLDACTEVIKKHVMGTTFYFVYILKEDIWEAGCLHLDIKFKEKEPAMALSRALAKAINDLQ